MAFLNEELRNFSAKGWLSILSTGSRSTSPDNLAWFEEFSTNDLIVKPSSIWSQLTSIPEAATISAAEAAAINNPSIISYYPISGAVHLTPSDTENAYFATSTYGDLSTRLRNWIMPQLIPRTDAGFEGMASIGYMVRIYQGDPNSGGTEITTTAEKSGAVPGWFMNFGAGAVSVASSFSTITDPTDVWMTGFRYVGQTGGSSTGGETGIQGVTGLPGVTGLIGETGVSGSVGNVGATGIQGIQGLIGQTGVQGVTGTSSDITVSNIGTGEGEVFKQKVANDIQLRNLKEGSSIDISLVDNDIVISSTVSASSVASEFLRIYGQQEQTGEVALTDSDTPYDIPNLAVTLPLAGDYLISYSTHFEASVDSPEVTTLDASSVLYNETQASYYPEAKARSSITFGDGTSSDLISKSRKFLHSVTKTIFVNGQANDVIKVRGIHEDTFNTISAKSVHEDSGSASMNSTFGYLSYEKASFFDESTVRERIFGQVSQTNQVNFTSSNTPTDISGMTVVLPVSGKYRIHYGVTCKTTVTSTEIPTVDIVSLLYNETSNEYLAEGRGDISLQFGSETEEDLISKTRSITGTIAKATYINVSGMTALKVRVMYTKPGTDDATVNVLYQTPISGYDGIEGYISFEKMSNL